jgi:glycosyltransferase involved in cell wall biosynthesis
MAIVPMCRALQAQGIEVLLVTTNAGGEETKSTRTVDYRGVPAIFFESQLGESFKYSRPLATWLNANAHHFDAGHIHAVFNHACVAAARAFRKANVPYVIRPLGTLDPWSMKQKPLRKRVFWSVAGKAMLSGAAGIHYTSQAEKSATENLLGVNHGTVIPLGIEPAPQSDVRSSHEPYLLVLSRLHPKKGLDVLIDAFVEIAAQFEDWRLIIAGDGPAADSLKQQAAPARDRIEFAGWLDGERKEAMLSGASVLVLPSYQENFGLCVMEALARSVPVIVSPHVNLANEISEANAGWIAPVEKDALAATLAEAMSDEDERQKRGRAGKLLSQRYSWERVAASLVELYTEITNGRAYIHRV